MGAPLKGGEQSRPIALFDHAAASNASEVRVISLGRVEVGERSSPIRGSGALHNGDTRSKDAPALPSRKFRVTRQPGITSGVDDLENLGVCNRPRTAVRHQLGVPHRVDFVLANVVLDLGVNRDLAQTGGGIRAGDQEAGQPVLAFPVQDRRQLIVGALGEELAHDRRRADHRREFHLRPTNRVVLRRMDTEKRTARGRHQSKQENVRQAGLADLRARRHRDEAARVRGRERAQNFVEKREQCPAVRTPKRPVVEHDISFGPLQQVESGWRL